jgi:hypothetical protein
MASSPIFLATTPLGKPDRSGRGSASQIVIPCARRSGLRYPGAVAKEGQSPHRCGFRVAG